MSDVTPIPDDFPRVCPYLTVDDADAAIAFYIEVLGATERVRLSAPDGTIGHAEIQLGEAVVMLADAAPELGVLSPRAVGGTPVMISVYVEDADAVFDQAVRAGATPLHPVRPQFYGDRTGQFVDPFGHRWQVASRVEVVSPEEMKRRMAALPSSQ
ncbi:VOC family protein [Frankia sp. R82]|uniref:VOC family protein n=1 Tax=Frankia sp. R82 TaxID=2950553 RepID=UPI00255AD747|nr:VOC family protein [Frankia sp. R82]